MEGTVERILVIFGELEHKYWENSKVTQIKIYKRELIKYCRKLLKEHFKNICDAMHEGFPKESVEKLY